MSDTYATEQEAFWAGEFGNDYVDRNTIAVGVPARTAMFTKVLSRTTGVNSALELGANIGINLHAFHNLLPNAELTAVEINELAANQLKTWGKAKNVFNESILTFEAEGQQWDFVFIAGVLIHINPESLPGVYDLMYLASRKYIMVCEYYNPSPVAIEYRGHKDRLFKRDFAGELWDKYPDLKLLDYAFCWRRDPNFPQDDVTWFLFEKGQMKAVFRADASSIIGSGHVMRCLTLANAMVERGWQCAFAVRGETSAIVPALPSSSHGIIELTGPEEDEAGKISEQVATCDLLVVDHYRREQTFEHSCRSFAGKIAAIDDLANRVHDCDLLLDQTLGRSADDYQDLVPAGSRLLLGAEYALLRPEFAQLRPQALERRKFPNPVRRILVSLGATDLGNVNKLVLESLKLASPDAAIDVVTGTATPEALGLLEVARYMPQEVAFHGFDTDLPALMCEADLAIGAAGTTSWERCCLGLPTLMIAIADNQKKIAGELAASGAAEVAGELGELDAEVLADMIRDLAVDEDRLQAMTNAAFEVCDGSGAERVAEIAATIQCCVFDVCLPAAADFESKRQKQKQHQKQILASVPFGSDICSDECRIEWQMSVPEHQNQIRNVKTN